MTRQYVLLALGILSCLIGAFLMFDGSILGKNTAGIATMMGILGIGVVSTSKKQARTRR